MPKLRGDDMLKWFRERRIAKSVEAVKIFVNENYKESPKTPSGTSSGIRYSRRAEPKFSRDSEPQTKYTQLMILRRKKLSQPNTFCHTFFPYLPLILLFGIKWFCF